MAKLVYIALIAVLIAHHTQSGAAFKIVNVNIQKGTGTSDSSAPSLPSPNALIEGVTGAINQKLSAVTSLVSNLVQLKMNLKRNLLNSVTSASSGSSSTSSSSSSSTTNQRPFFTKTVSFGFNGGSAPASTAGSAATTGGYQR